MTGTMPVKVVRDQLVLGPVTVNFQRTLRIPETGLHPLPPGLGRFPLRRVEDYPDTAPAEWLARGGVMLPIYQREAMWLSFDASEPAALQVGVGKVCAVSGLPWIEHLVGDPNLGLGQFLQTLEVGRISIAALSLSLTQAVLDLALEYAQQRQQFGQPISKFQAVQFKLADIATELEAARWLTYRAAALRDAGRPFMKEAAMAKLKASRLAAAAASEAVQIHGGLGYMLDSPVARFYCDSKVLEIGEGTNEIQHLVIARALGC